MTTSCRCCGTFVSRKVRVVSRWSSIKTDGLFFPSFNSFTGRLSGLTAFAFAITFYCLETPSSVVSVPSALTTGGLRVHRNVPYVFGATLAR